MYFACLATRLDHDSDESFYFYYTCKSLNKRLKAETSRPSCSHNAM